VKGKLATALFCLVFAIPFGGVGVGASWVVVKMIQDGHRAEDWVRVQATVDSWSRGSIAYHYKFGDATYQGDRLGVNPIGGKDNIDSWYSDMASMISDAKSGRKPLMVWVNPENPTESMVDRTIRWKLVAFALPFALGFGGVGVGALWVLVRMLFARSGTDAVAAAAPSGVLGLWIFTFFWNVISFPIAIVVVPDAVAKGEYAVLFVLLFPLIGVLMLWGAISSTITAIKNAFRRRFTTTPDQQQPVAPPAPVNDGVFARGMLDDPRGSVAMGGGGAAGVIDTMDDGMPPPPDPTVAEWEKLAGGKLSAEQREQLDKMNPTTRAMVGKLAGWLGKMKKTQK
jgi:hypothetical protein